MMNSFPWITLSLSIVAQPLSAITHILTKNIPRVKEEIL